MSVVPPGDYPNNRVPTIFAEEVPHAQPAPAADVSQTAGLVISKGTVSMIIAGLLGVLIAGALFMSMRLSEAKKSTEALKTQLASAQTDNKKLVETISLLQADKAKIAQYQLIEDYTAEMQKVRDTINADLVYAPNYPKKKLVNLDTPKWKEDVERTMKAQLDRLQALSIDIKKWRPATVIVKQGGGLPKPGEIRAAGSN